jgi:fructose-bisphosphate aldolase class I
MVAQDLIDTARAMVADGKGLLAMDESNPTCNKRFAPLGIPQTESARRVYRELIVTTPGLGESINGAILYDEMIRQKTTKGTSFVDVLVEAGIIPGIKVPWALTFSFAGQSNTRRSISGRGTMPP